MTDWSSPLGKERVAEIMGKRKRVSDIEALERRLSTVEPRLRQAVGILLSHEDTLTDGYGYYCEYFASEQADERHNDDLVVAALEVIAREIVESYIPTRKY